MTPFDFITYMQTIATNLKDIQHTAETPRFHKISSIANLEELLQTTIVTNGIQMLVLDTHEGGIIDNDAAGLFDDMYYTFYLVQNLDITDMSERQTTLAALKLSCKKIMSKMFKDMKDDGNKAIDDRIGLNMLDRNSIRYLTVGPMGDNYQGIQVTFTLAETFSYAYKAADWLP